MLLSVGGAARCGKSLYEYHNPSGCRDSVVGCWKDAEVDDGAHAGDTDLGCSGSGAERHRREHRSLRRLADALLSARGAGRRGRRPRTTPVRASPSCFAAQSSHQPLRFKAPMAARAAAARYMGYEARVSRPERVGTAERRPECPRCQK